jgi:uncharacterized protein (DUF3084 family)
MSTTASITSDSQRPAASPAQRTKEAKEAFTASLNSVGASIDAELKARAAQIRQNSKALADQEGNVKKETKALAKENDNLQKLLDKTKKQMKGMDGLGSNIGDLDADMAMLEETLRLVEEGWDEDEDDDEEEHASEHVSEEHPSSTNNNT